MKTYYDNIYYEDKETYERCYIKTCTTSSEVQRIIFKKCLLGSLVYSKEHTIENCVITKFGYIGVSLENIINTHIHFVKVYDEKLSFNDLKKLSLCKIRALAISSLSDVTFHDIIVYLNEFTTLRYVMIPPEWVKHINFERFPTLKAVNGESIC